MFQGGEYGKTKVANWEYEKDSILDQIVRNKNVYLKSELNMINFSSFLFTHLLDSMAGKTEHLGNILSLDKPKVLKGLRFTFSPQEIKPYDPNYNPPPPYKTTIFYKKWKLMDPEEQKLWDQRFERHKEQERERSNSIAKDLIKKSRKEQKKRNQDS